MNTVFSPEEKEKVSREKLGLFVRKYDIFIDTCSLLETDKIAKFWENVTPLLKQEHKHINILGSVERELERFARSPELCTSKHPEDPEGFQRRAILALRTLLTLMGDDENEGVVRILYEIDPDQYTRDHGRELLADYEIHTVFSRHRMEHDLLLITQDKTLAGNVDSLNTVESSYSKHHIRVRQVNQHGFLSPVNDCPTDRQESRMVYLGAQRSDVPAAEKFSLADAVTEVSGTTPLSRVPTESDEVLQHCGGCDLRYTLIKQLGSGGEGCVYATGDTYNAAKIYKARNGQIDLVKYRKLERMLEKDLDCEGICFPTALLYTMQGEFAGYLMPRVPKEAKPLANTVFRRRWLESQSPAWTKKETAQLCVTILEKLKYLHDRNIILGDINPANILMVSPTEVYFVDTDSYQIEGYPCPVGQCYFTPPELQHKRYGSELRTMGADRFAIATLLFMIMVPGKSPYTHQGGDDQADDILEGNFPYPLGEYRTGEVPKGPWGYCWSHLTYELKAAFFGTFNKEDGRYYAPDRRPTVDMWLEWFRRYLGLLTDSTLRQQDEMSLDIFPIRFKKHPNNNVEYVRCRLCGREVEEARTEEGICRDCLDSGEVLSCSICGSAVLYTNRRKYIDQKGPHELCTSCSNTIYDIRVCKDCGHLFILTLGEALFMAKNGHELPRRCKSCRDRRKYGGL